MLNLCQSHIGSSKPFVTQRPPARPETSRTPAIFLQSNDQCQLASGWENPGKQLPEVGLPKYVYMFVKLKINKINCCNIYINRY